MRGSLEDQLLAVDDLAGVEFRIVHIALVGGRDAWVETSDAISRWQRGQVVESVVPGHVDRRHIAALREAEQDRRRVGEEEIVVAVCPDHADLVGQAQLKELMDGVEQVSTPVAQRAHTEVVPATPVAQVIIDVVIVVSALHQPGHPVERIGQGLLIGIFIDVGIPLVPAARVIHMGGDGGHVLDDARVHPGLELEIVRLRVALVAHLCYRFRMTAGRLHHQFRLVEGAGHRLLDIDMLAL